jgi:hypothetical protein
MKTHIDKQGRPCTLIKFTKNQQAKIGLLLAHIRDANGEGGLLGQVMKTGIVVKLCTPHETQEIRKITGATRPYIYYPEQQL